MGGADWHLPRCQGELSGLVKWRQLGASRPMVTTPSGQLVPRDTEALLSRASSFSQEAGKPDLNVNSHSLKILARIQIENPLRSNPM